MSFESQGTKSKTQARSGGPRTSLGKATSSQNSSKHRIFVHHVLPEEKTDASVLFEEIREEFRLVGPMELKIGCDLVQNEFESQRIEKFAAQQSLKARNLAELDVEQFQVSSEFRMRRPIPAEKECQSDYLAPLRPEWCAVFLKGLKKSIKSRGLRPDEDMAHLHQIFGTELAGQGEAIRLQYKLFQLNQTGEYPTDGKTRDYEADLLMVIDTAISINESLAAQEALQSAVISAPVEVALPSDGIWDRIEKYRTAHARKRNRLLETLQTIRRLKREM